MNDVAKEEFDCDLNELTDILKGTDLGKVLKLLVNMINTVEELCTEGTQLNKGNYMLHSILILK